MDMDDIEPADGEAQNPGMGRKYTAHFFGDMRPELFGARALQAIRVPEDRSDWPPDVLFEAVYGATVMYNFGKGNVLEEWQSKFYPGERTIAARADEQRRLDEAATLKDNVMRQTHERTLRHEALEQRRQQLDNDDRMDNMDIFITYPFMFMPREDLERYLKQLSEKKAAAEREELDAKVNSWRREITEGM